MEVALRTNCSVRNHMSHMVQSALGDNRQRESRDVLYAPQTVCAGFICVCVCFACCISKAIQYDWAAAICRMHVKGFVCVWAVCCLLCMCRFYRIEVSWARSAPHIDRVRKPFRWWRVFDALQHSYHQHKHQTLLDSVRLHTILLL